MCESSMAVPVTSDVTKKEEEKFDTSYTNVLDISSDSFSNIANSDVFNVSLTEQLEEISDYHEMIQGECLLPISNSISGIEASDIGNLLEQFLEYEQGSESYSYPDSTCWTPTESPSEDSNNDPVLGQLMSVKEVLSKEAHTEIISSSQHDSVNNNLSFKPKGDGLLRTINGVHPKGDNLRMADSPKFAKFKKKKLTKEPPIRRSVSGTTTPRCTSPSQLMPLEEIKKREAKLIEALAFSDPKQKSKKTHILTNNKVNLIQKHENSDHKHILSRLQPVVSKRNKLAVQKENDTKCLQVCIDPRLNKEAYGESKNVIQFLDTNLTDSSLCKKKHSDLIDDITIVDMTVDHDVVPAKISVSNTSSKLNLKASAEIDKEQVQLLISPQLTINNNNTTSVAPDRGDFNEKLKVNINEECKKLPKNYRKNQIIEVAELISSDSQVEMENDNDQAYNHKNSMKTANDKTVKNQNRHHSNSPRHRSRSKSINHSRSSSQNRSRSPYRVSYSKGQKQGSSRSRSRSRSNSVSSFRSSLDEHRKRFSSESEHEIEDINEKLTELSNPVPYDIEHERKLRFLVGKAAKGDFERRNIYVGGISKETTKSSLNERFQRFGKIEKITLHFRDKGDNYAFIVYDEPEDAKRAIEEGNDDENYPTLELCFGGRRKFVGGSYVDFDGNNSYLEEKVRRDANSRCGSPEDDFDKLLKMALKEKSVDRTKKEITPEWS